MFIPQWLLAIILIFASGLAMHLYKQGYKDAEEKFTAEDRKKFEKALDNLGNAKTN